MLQELTLPILYIPLTKIWLKCTYLSKILGNTISLMSEMREISIFMKKNFMSISLLESFHQNPKSTKKIHQKFSLICDQRVQFLFCPWPWIKSLQHFPLGSNPQGKQKKVRDKPKFELTNKFSSEIL